MKRPLNSLNIIQKIINSLNINSDMECEICGEDAQRVEKRLVENIPMLLCENCKEMGKPMPRKRPAHQRRRSTPAPRKTRQRRSSRPSSGPSNRGSPRGRPQRPSPKRKSPSRPRRPTNSTEEVKENAGELIRKLRKSLGLSIEDFAESIKEKVSYARRIEQDRVSLPIKIAKKIEEIYDISLVLIRDLLDEDDIATEFDDFIVENEQNTRFTLGDFVKVKEKKKKKEN